MRVWSDTDSLGRQTPWRAKHEDRRKPHGAVVQARPAHTPERARAARRRPRSRPGARLGSPLRGRGDRPSPTRGEGDPASTRLPPRRQRPPARRLACGAECRTSSIAGRGVGMYVCLCAAVSEREVRALVGVGTASVEDLGEVWGAGSGSAAAAPRARHAGDRKESSTLRSRVGLPAGVWVGSGDAGGCFVVP